MNWKLILTTSVIAGMISIPLQIYGIYLSAMSDYGNITSNLVILLGLILLLAAGIFGLVYSQTKERRLAQGLITVVLAFAIGFVISLIGVRIFFQNS